MVKYMLVEPYSSKKSTLGRMYYMLTEVSILPIQSVYFIGERAITAEVLNEEPLIVNFMTF